MSASARSTSAFEYRPVRALRTARHEAGVTRRWRRAWHTQSHCPWIARMITDTSGIATRIPSSSMVKWWGTCQRCTQIRGRLRRRVGENASMAWMPV